jgi:2-methylisocitrate lyase-like PEP mutase family enzyme
MAMSHRALATAFRALHVSGKPIVVTNCYDAISAKTIAEIPSTRALATASFAIATAAGTSDDDMTLDINLAAVSGIAKVAKECGLPLTVDFQDGYGDRLEEGIEKLLAHGVVGVNIEDWDKVAQKLIPPETAAERVRRVLTVTKKHGIDDFVVNARADSMLHGGTLSDALTRGKAYLDAGATTVFLLGGTSPAGGMSKEEVTEAVRALDGKVNIGFKLAPGRMSVKELGDLGVSRISIGPTLQFAAMKALKEEAEKILASGGL